MDVRMGAVDPDQEERRRNEKDGGIGIIQRQARSFCRLHGPDRGIAAVVDRFVEQAEPVNVVDQIGERRDDSEDHQSCGHSGRRP